MSNYTSGTYEDFAYDSSNRVISVTKTGTINPVIADGASGGLPLQPNAATGIQQYWQEGFSYPNSGETQRTDTDGHASNWFYDSVGRVTETQEWTGAPNNLWLTSYASWNGSNNLIESVDPRGNPTDYGYDANGNTISVQEPQVTTSLGTGRPVARYSYDEYNNLVAYCDPQYVWTSGVTTCSPGSGSTHYTWNYTDSNEPYGYLTDTYTPLGYHHSIAYSTSAQSGDFGLPTSVTGDPIVQNDGNTPNRVPYQAFVYDPYGNLICYSKLQDGNGTHWWRLTYDNLNRQTAVADPDDASMQSKVSCPNSAAAGISGSYLVTTTSHLSDGAISATQTPAEYAGGVSTTYTYDADGNEITETHHYAQTSTNSVGAGITTKWYDAADRLVEVQQPRDTAHDVYTFAWMTRYIYDLSQGSTVSINGGATSFQAHGNLYKTQECLAGTSVTIGSPGNSPQTVSGCGWQDVRGNTFDALDRSLAKYEVGVGAAAESTNTYDSNGNYGLLAVKSNATSQSDTLSYDADGELISETFSDGTPNRQYAYDPDGRQTTLTSSAYGSEQRKYDADGRLTASTTSSGLRAVGTTTYSYYNDGLRSALSLSIPLDNFNQSNLFTYTYRPDGERDALHYTDGSSSGTFAWTYSGAGRELTQTDPDTGVTVTAEGLSGLPASQTLGAKKYTYDQYGRVSGLQLPEPYYTYAYSQDNEGELSKAVATQISAIGPQTYATTVRNEVTAPAGASGLMANGTGCQQPPSLDYASGSCVVNALSGAVKSVTYAQPNITGQMTHVYTYDSDGREVSDASSACSPSATSTRNYDADNHVTSQAMPQYYEPGYPSCYNTSSTQYQNPTTNTYTWGADGRIAQTAVATTMSGTTYTVTNDYGWDGDDALYWINIGGGGPLIYIEKLGVLNGAAYTTPLLGVYDRDISGTTAATHDVHGYSAWQIDPIEHAYKKTPAACQTACGAQYGTSGFQDPTGAGLSPTRGDGYSDVVNSFQGVRAFDPYSAQWTAPDAYSGNVRDPMSQKPYMWNNNNPITYSDPSGYCASDPYSAKSDPCLKSGVGEHHMQALQAATKTLDAIGQNAFSFVIPAGPELGGVRGLLIAGEHLVGGAAKSVGIKIVTYADRVVQRMIDDPGMHGFSQYVDKLIFDKGNVSIDKGYVKFTAQGTYEGREGQFQIYGHLDQNGNFEVDHRFFKPN